MLNMTSSRKFSFAVGKSYNKTVNDFHLDRHKDLSTLKSNIHLGLVASVNIYFLTDQSSCRPH